MGVEFFEKISGSIQSSISVERESPVIKRSAPGRTCATDSAPILRERIELSFSDLYAIYDTFGMYLDRIGAGPKKEFEDSQALFDDLSEVVGMIAKFKQMTKISENSVVLVDFLKLTNVLLTIYMIKLFKNFLRLPEEKVYTAYESEVDVLTKKTIDNAFVGKAEERLKLATKRSLSETVNFSFK